MRHVCLALLVVLAPGCSREDPGPVDAGPPADARAAPGPDLAADLGAPADLRPFGGWSRRLGEGGFSEINGIAIDSKGNVVVAPEGRLRWARPVVAATSSQVWSIAVGEDDGPRLALTFIGAIDLGRGPLPGSQGSALARYTAAGDLLWARSFGQNLSTRSVAAL